MDDNNVIIIGAGPIGMACAIELKRKGIASRIIEKGAPADNIRKWPQGMTFFSTPERINLGSIPFTAQDMRPTREEALKYYHAVSDYFQLNIVSNTLVKGISKEGNSIRVETDDGIFEAAHVILATGYYDHPNTLDIEGEDQANVSHYLRDPFKYVHSRVLIVGGSHSAADAALTIYRLGAAVVMVHRGPKLSDRLKYWIKPDLENRIREGSIKAHFNTRLMKVSGREALLYNAGKEQTISETADHVLLLTGYRPDTSLLQSAGITVEPDSLVPSYDAHTFESNVEGIYLAGSLTAGRHVSQIFIENGREHAKAIAHAIAEKMEKVGA